jgi:EAL domain-containing protein (putative c-di-GMP-specific phosphodiesterase class I)
MAELVRGRDAVAERITRATDQGQPVIAGGVETPEQRDELAALGCVLVSGHLIGRPEPGLA